ncbi:MAG: hypothetical protein IE916_00905 [Epsilonproteobacteria bacterium]|nr:hypothetical protein [Campylobacterota bacterium]
MAITYENNRATFASVIYEDEVVAFRDYLQEHAGEEIVFDFSECDDIHLAILQLIVAYKKNYACSYVYGDKKRLYEMFLEGFDISEDDCN